MHPFQIEYSPIDTGPDHLSNLFFRARLLLVSIFVCPACCFTSAGKE